MKFLGVPWVLRPRRTEQKLALSLLSMLPSAHVYRVGVRVVCFRGSMATPPILYLRFAGSLAVAAQDSRPSGSLLLPCKALSSPTSCRFIPAHKHLHYAQTTGETMAQVCDIVFSDRWSGYRYQPRGMQLRPATSPQFCYRMGAERVCVRTHLSPVGAGSFPTCTHGLRRGLHAFAASRLETAGLAHPDQQTEISCTH